MRRIALAVAFVIIALSLASSALAQTGGDYGLAWSTVDGGGAATVGGPYELAGTVGQFDAASTLGGGNYALEGGFWSIATGSQFAALIPTLKRVRVAGTHGGIARHWVQARENDHSIARRHGKHCLRCGSI